MFVSNLIAAIDFFVFKRHVEKKRRSLHIEPIITSLKQIWVFLMANLPK